MGFLFGFLIHSRKSSSNEFSFGLNDGSHSFSDVPLPSDRLPFPTQLLTTYLAEYETKIDGWFSREVLYATWVLIQYQYDHLKIFGGIGEIGVHHGKFTAFLYLMRRYREQTLFAVDVFENQKLNRDVSGNGRENIFLNTIRKYGDVHRNEVVIYSGSSLDLNPQYTSNQNKIHWWRERIVKKRGLQFVSVSCAFTMFITFTINFKRLTHEAFSFVFIRLMVVIPVC